MAFVTIDPVLIEVGEPTRKELFQTIKDDLDDHESRISTAENSVNVSKEITFPIVGNYAFNGPKTAAAYYKLISDITVQAVKIHQFKAYTSGTTEFDVLYKRGVGAFTTIFTSRPTVTSANGDFYTSNNGIISTTDLLVNDIIRLDITSTQTGGFETHSITVTIEYEVA